jgi:DNA-binding XRE family transcriptional regulator
MAENRSVFWDDLTENLKVPIFRHQYILEPERIVTIDRLVNEFDDIREQQGLTKADLARAISRQPEAMRRLLTAGSVNPELGLVAEMAAPLGYRVSLEPMSADCAIDTW